MRNKKERGSITLFVLVTCIFIVIVLVTFMVNVENKKQAQKKEIEQITKSYNQNEQKMEEIYSKIVNQ